MQIRYLLLLMLLLFNAICAEQPSTLKLNDVHKIMDQIFKQHVEKKEMSGPILQHAFKLYIEQFDPYHLYLLNDEVKFYLQPSSPELAVLLTQYKNNDLSAFIRLNNIFKNAIQRARGFRKDLSYSLDSIFQPSTLRQPLADERTEPYAENAQVLKTRIRQDFIRFILQETRRYGFTSVEKDKPKILDLYDKVMRQGEVAYMGTDEQDHPLTGTEKENLLAMHILKALAGALDAHTKFMDVNEAYDMRIKLEKEFEGIGIHLRQEGDSIVITGLVPNSPASKNGNVNVKDKIIAIDGKSVVGLDLAAVLDLLHNTKRSTTTLQLARNSEQITVTLKRAPITLSQGRVETSSTPFDDGIIGKITLHSFYRGEKGVSSEDDVREAIKSLEKKGNLRGLILDLRDNTGGFLTQAVKVAGLFITSGVVVIAKYSNGEEHFYRDVNGKASYNGPLIVLTSRQTASAAEIVAQALQDYGVALIVGDEHTYGKGTIQSQTVTEGGETTYFKVTVGKYYTVSGKTPQLQGVKADIVVPSQLNTEPIGEEFLEYTEKTDTIPAVYNDPLTDVNPSLKGWYLRYYIPSLQHRETRWRNLLPMLKRNSENRISQNRDYQAYIRHMRGLPSTLEPQEAGWLFPDKPPKSTHQDDLQMSEAVNIMKDMLKG